MYKAVTRDISVSVYPEFLPEHSEPDAMRFMWAYTIEITNHSRTRVQLMSRRWIITDAMGRERIVEGVGVVGEQPILNSGESYRYTSGCPLTTPSGIMAGSYQMIDETGAPFDVVIPTFSLDSPMQRHILN
jgi:ApaG protein